MPDRTGLTATTSSSSSSPAADEASSSLPYHAHVHFFSRFIVPSDNADSQGPPAAAAPASSDGEEESASSSEPPPASSSFIISRLRFVPQVSSLFRAHISWTEGTERAMVSPAFCFVRSVRCCFAMLCVALPYLVLFCAGKFSSDMCSCFAECVARPFVMSWRGSHHSHISGWCCACFVILFIC